MANRKYPKDPEELFNCLLEYSKPFNGRWAWRLGDPASCQQAQREGMVDRIAEAHGWEYAYFRYPTEPEELFNYLLERSEPFNGKYDWQLGDRPSYAKAQKTDLIDRVAEAHGWEITYTQYPTDEEELFNCLLEYSKPFNGRKSWELGNNPSYQKARLAGLIDRIAEAHGWEYVVNGYKPDQPGVLYLQCINWVFWKTGITNNDLYTRMKGNLFPDNEYKAVFEIKFEDGKIPPLAEKEILDYVKDRKYEGPPLYKYTGNTEVFVCEDYTKVHGVIEIARKWENTATTKELKKTSTPLLTPQRLVLDL